MLFNSIENKAAGTAVLPAATFPFDWVNETYEMERGSPKEVTGVEAVKAWLELVLRTAQGRYAIWPADFGASLYNLMGRKLPRGAVLSELQRQLQESAAYCPTIQEVGQVVWDGTAVTCTITLEDQTTEVITVEP